MVLKSYAKINLTLSVNKRLMNGLHDLQSIFCLINLFDKIEIKKNFNQSNDKINFYGPHSKNLNNSYNSVKKVLNIMRKRKLISDFYSVKTYKNIPKFSGFGGGTSNAATVMKFLLKKKIKKNL